MNPWEVSSEQRFEQKKEPKNRLKSVEEDSRSTLIQWMHAISIGGFVFRTIRRNVWAMSHEILGKIEQFRVRVHQCSPVREERREKREERETLQENEWDRVKTFYIKRWTGWVLTRSSTPCCGPLDLGPDGSGSIQRPCGVLEIRIHQPARVWAGYPRLFGFFPVFLDFFYAHPHSCYLDPLCTLIFLQKFQKITMCSWYVFDCFCDIFTCSN